MGGLALGDFVWVISNSFQSLLPSFKLKVSFCRDACYKCAEMRHLNVLVYDLQIVICPGSLTGKPDSHISALRNEEKIPLVI